MRGLRAPKGAFSRCVLPLIRGSKRLASSGDIGVREEAHYSYAIGVEGHMEQRFSAKLLYTGFSGCFRR
jgi:hypothetical protein